MSFSCAYACDMITGSERLAPSVQTGFGALDQDSKASTPSKRYG